MSTDGMQPNKTAASLMEGARKTYEGTRALLAEGGVSVPPWHEAEAASVLVCVEAVIAAGRVPMVLTREAADGVTNDILEDMAKAIAVIGAKR